MFTIGFVQYYVTYFYLKSLIFVFDAKPYVSIWDNEYYFLKIIKIDIIIVSTYNLANINNIDYFR